MLVLTTFCLFFATLLLYVKWVFKNSRSYFDAAGIPYLEPEWFFGNTKDIMMQKKPITILYQELYEKFESHKLVGFFYMHNPTIVVRDPELINNIMIRDFNYFSHHNRNAYKEVEPLSYNLFTMKGDEWKTLRAKLTPTFTSSKIKLMFPLVKKCSENLKFAIEKNFSNPDGIEVVDLGKRYTSDVIASCAFGLDVNSLMNPDSEFNMMEKRFFAPRWQAVVRNFFPDMPLKMVKLLRLQHNEKTGANYFINLIRDTVEYRKKNNVTRGDFLDIMITLKNQIEAEKFKIDPTTRANEPATKPNIDITPEMIAAQCFLFLSGGFSTTSNALSYILFELAQHREVQEKVRSEITSIWENNDQNLTYESLTKMPYLEMVIQESMRRTPAVGFLSRMTGQEYKFRELNFNLKPNTTIIIPARALHYDKKYYEKPHEFYPEHFTPEAISKRPHFTYLPFGAGPRSCIAYRFAKMQLIVGIVYILRFFSVQLSPKTKLPLEYASGVGNPMLWTKSGIWIKFQPL